MGKTYYLYQETENMHGPYLLNESNLAKAKLKTPGVYLLAEKHSKGMLVRYVGRSVNLGKRLVNHIGKTTHFYYKPTETESGAFFVECREFHKYGKANHLDNSIHPAVPAGSSLPACSEKGCKGEAY